MNLEIGQRFETTEKEYFCLQCKSEYTQMEVLDEIELNGMFVCKRCEHDPNTRTDYAGPAHQGHEVMGRLNAQLAAFEDLMRQIDATSIPENDFDAAIANALPIQRSQSINPAVRSEPARGTNLPPTTVYGLKTEPEKIQISLLDDSQASKDHEQTAEAERHAKPAAQNALPAWQTTATVTGKQTHLAPEEATR